MTGYIEEYCALGIKDLPSITSISPKAETRAADRVTYIYSPTQSQALFLLQPSFPFPLEILPVRITAVFLP